jgi:hypothetical protein
MWWIGLFGFVAIATAQAAVKVYEPFTIQPGIHEVRARSHLGEEPDFRPQWRASIEYVAALLELYPDAEIYFMARDGIFPAYIAELELGDLPEASRIHVINVSSSTSINDPNVGKYLSENGISSRSRRKIIFCDSTIASGATLDALARQLGPNADLLLPHPIASRRWDSPRSRLAMAQVEDTPPLLDANQLQDGFAFEHVLPKYTGNSLFFERRPDPATGALRWTPMSLSAEGTGWEQTPYGSYAERSNAASKARARRAIEDLKSFVVNDPGARRLMSARRRFWKTARTALVSGDSELMKAAMDVFDRSEADPVRRKAARLDVLDLAATNFYSSDRSLAAVAAGLELDHADLAALYEQKSKRLFADLGPAAKSSYGKRLKRLAQARGQELEDPCGRALVRR